MKYLLLFIPSLLFCEISSEDIFKCNQHDYKKCNEIGNRYFNISSPDYNLEKSQYPLKMACEYGNIDMACYNSAQYYISKNDKTRAKQYYEKSCKLGNDTACYVIRSMK